MKLIISKEAAQWYKKELDVEDTDTLRFYVRYGGVGGKIPGFSLGIKVDHPQNIHASTELEGVLFFVEQTDGWYFEESDLNISFDDKRQEPVMNYV